MDTSALKCSTCGKECKNASGLRLHQTSHLKDEAKVEPKVETPPIMTVPTVTTTTLAATTMVNVVTNVPAKQEEVAEIPPYNFKKYLELPQPLREHLENVFGNWLNYIEVGQEWRNDFGGYGLYIKVPKEYSTEWEEVTTPVYDNTTRKAVGEKKVIVPDVRWKPIKDIMEVKSWIDLVKGHIMTHAYKKGIRLPNTNTGIDMTKATLDQYQTAIAGTKN